MRTKFVTIIIGCFVLPQIAGSQTPVRIFVSNGVRPVVEELRPQCERASGRPLALQFDSTAGLRQKMNAGEPFDAAVLTTAAIDDLIKEGKLSANGRADVARAGIGVGMRTGAPKPKIGTPDSMKQTLLNAKSITYVGDGASRAYIEKMIEILGITDRVKPKTVLAKNIDESIAAVASGKTELWVTLMSEIMAARGIELIGPLPPQFQNYVSFAAAVNAKTINGDPAKAVIQCLTARSADAILKKKGMERAPH